MLSDSSAMWREQDAKQKAFDRIVEPARKSLEDDIARCVCASKAWSGHFGATGIDPKHLFVYFVVPARPQVEALVASSAWADLRARLIGLLRDGGYPTTSLQGDWLNVFSQQQCDEEFNGNWYHFFK